MSIGTAFDQGVMRLSIKVAEARNALDFATVAEMRAAVASARNRDGLRLLVLESGLDKVFSLGMNLTKLQEEATSDAWTGFEHIAEFAELLVDLASMPVPTLAIVDGVAAAGGVELACSCDVVIGTTNASFSIAQLRKGIFPFITSAILVPRIGQARFLHWALSGQTFPARRLFELGLINQLCNPAERDRTVSIFIERVLSFDEQTLRAGIGTLRAEAEPDLRSRIRHAHAMFSLNCMARLGKATP